MLWSISSTVLIWLILSFMIKNIHKSSTIMSLILILFFSYGHVFTIVNNFPEKNFGISSDLYLSTSYLVIVIICIRLILISKKSFNFFTGYMNIISIVLILFPIYTFLIFLSQQNDTKLEEVNDHLYIDYFDKSNMPKSKPDIYYIILDGYAREDVFKDVYNYDNSQFYDELKSLGFYIAEKSRANYALTLSSLTSSLNMRYLDTISSRSNYSNKENYIKGLSQQFSRNFVGGYFKRLGYKFVTLTSGISWAEIESSDENITPKYTMDEFENLIVSTTLLRTLFGLIPLNSPYYLHKKRILFNLDKLKTIDERQEPVFVFAHILAPHRPFVFADTSLISTNTVIDFSEGFRYHKSVDSLQRDYRDKYIAQVKVLNSKVLNTIQEIKKKQKDFIIILQSDHGPASLRDWESINYASINERLSILNAFYFPPNSNVNIYNSITPVNTFRVIFNHFFNGKFNLLEDKCYFSTMANPYSFILVEDSFKNQGPK